MNRYLNIDSKRLATTRLVEHVQRQCLRQPFLSLAQEIGIDEKTVRNISDDHIKQLDSEISFETPRVMGIDEINVVGKPRAVITNVGKNCLYDILPARRKDMLMAYFNRKRIRLVAIDMWRPYRDVVEACMPDATIVIDKLIVSRIFRTFDWRLSRFWYFMLRMPC